MENDIRIGAYLALRQIRRASLWTTGLIVFVMVLTFLNLVVISGILVGLIQGSIEQFRTQYTGDVIISPRTERSYIEETPNILATLSTVSRIESFSPRYTSRATLEADYLNRKEGEKLDTASGIVYGIDVDKEHETTRIADFMLEGKYLEKDDFDQILIGYFLLKKYLPFDDSPNFTALKNAGVGSKVRVTINGNTREMTIKGILSSKVDNLRMGVYMTDTQLRAMSGRDDNNVGEIAIKVDESVDPLSVRKALSLRGLEKYAKVQTFEEAQPQGLKDIINTFSMLGGFFSSIGLVVAFIVIFIVIFINALTRRKFIGILKGIGITGSAIEWAYIFQSTFYAVCGSSIGLLLVYGFLVPYFQANPINFPFSDGILYAPYETTFFRVALLVFATLVAGYLPARMIVRKNTLDSILGRN